MHELTQCARGLHPGRTAAHDHEVQGAGATEEDAARRLIAELEGSTGLARAIRRAERRRPAAPVPPAFSARRLWADLLKDTRYAGRLLRRTPGSTIAALVTLTLGVGMTTAIFSVVQAVLLRPVPFPEPERLVLMWETDRNSGTTREPASIPDLVDYRRSSRLHGADTNIFHLVFENLSDAGNRTAGADSRYESINSLELF